MRRGPIFDAIILGAGAAGLAAGRELSCAGCRVLILEARERIGGRIRTHADWFSPVPIELGAEFVHGSAPITVALLQAAHQSVYEVPNVHYRSKRGRLSPTPHFWTQIAHIQKKIGPFVKHAASRDFSALEFIRRARLPAAQREMFVSFIEGFDAAELEKLSARSMWNDAQQTAGQMSQRQADGAEDSRSAGRRNSLLCR